MLKQLKKQPVHSQPSTQSRRKKQKRTAGFFSNQRYRISASFGLRKEVRQQMESDNRIYQGTEKSHGLFFFLTRSKAKKKVLKYLGKPSAIKVQILTETCYFCDEICYCQKQNGLKSWKLHTARQKLLLCWTVERSSKHSNPSLPAPEMLKFQTILISIWTFLKVSALKEWRRI